MVLFPAEFKLSRSLRKALRNKNYQIRLDTHFKAVVEACARTRRKDQAGTWISPEIRDAYVKLHELGYAHSVETWVDDHLVGGLYGIAIGKMFYGESMFAHATDASKIAFAHLVSFLSDHAFGLIDCQIVITSYSIHYTKLYEEVFLENHQTLQIVLCLFVRY